MPIYEYMCVPCGHEFETLVLRQSQQVACPHCKSTDLEKKLSCFGFKSGGSSSVQPVASSSKASGCGSCSSKHCGSCH